MNYQNRKKDYNWKLRGVNFKKWPRKLYQLQTSLTANPPLIVYSMKVKKADPKRNWRLIFQPSSNKMKMRRVNIRRIFSRAFNKENDDIWILMFKIKTFFIQIHHVLKYWQICMRVKSILNPVWLLFDQNNFTRSAGAYWSHVNLILISKANSLYKYHYETLAFCYVIRCIFKKVKR